MDGYPSVFMTQPSSQWTTTGEAHAVPPLNNLLQLCMEILKQAKTSTLDDHWISLDQKYRYIALFKPILKPFMMIYDVLSVNLRLATHNSFYMFFFLG